MCPDDIKSSCDSLYTVAPRANVRISKLTHSPFMIAVLKCTAAPIFSFPFLGAGKRQQLPFAHTFTALLFAQLCEAQRLVQPYTDKGARLRNLVEGNQVVTRTVTERC